MSLTIPPGFAEARVFWSLDGDPDDHSVSFGVDATAGATAAGIASDIQGAFTTWQAQWGSAYTLQGTDVVFNDGGVERTGTDRTPFNSGAAAANLPQNVALLVQKGTGLVGRKNRGRFYFPPGRLAEVDVSSSGVIDAADVTVIQGELNTLRTNIIAGANIDGVVVLHTNPADTPTPVLSFNLDNVVATQRRRLR